jgi:3-hydroxybutyrate dehydrogenase
VRSDGMLHGRHAVVTGGGRGIGAAVATALAQHGASLTLMGRDGAALDLLAAELRDEFGGDVGGMPCDVTRTDEVTAAFARARSERGEPYILVNNAGQAEGRPFLETDRDLWDRMLAVNLTGAYLCTQQVLRGMLDTDEGRIVNVASTSGLKGYRNVSAYCAAKHGLIGLTRALAAETVRTGITVNAVCPAYTDTAMAADAVRNIMRDMNRTEAEARALLTRPIPRRRLITPAEVAAAVVWLCSPHASGVTGVALPVAGGEIQN